MMSIQLETSWSFWSAEHLFPKCIHVSYISNQFIKKLFLEEAEGEHFFPGGIWGFRIPIRTYALYAAYITNLSTDVMTIYRESAIWSSSHFCLYPHIGIIFLYCLWTRNCYFFMFIGIIPLNMFRRRRYMGWCYKINWSPVPPNDCSDTPIEYKFWDTPLHFFRFFMSAFGNFFLLVMAVPHIFIPLWVSKWPVVC